MVNSEISLQWYQGNTDSSIISKQQNCIYLILQRMQIFLMISLLPNLHL